MLFGLLIATLIVIADQLTKYWVYNHILNEVNFITYNSYFNLVKAWNTGVSFSMFNDGGMTGRVLLVIVALTIVGLLIFWLKNEKDKYLSISYSLIIGGAIGNVIDRIRFGAVFDFLDFHIKNNHWPAFNLADSFICIGAIIIIFHSLFAEKKTTGEINEK
jgi:signal peptidase II